jgi:pyrimidine-nucleoside phosphorylase
MKKKEDAVFLAQLMVETGERMGKKTVALITDMDQPLGLQAGNSLEVKEVLEILQGSGPDDLRQLCIELAAWMIWLGSGAAGLAEARTAADRLIRSGKALEKFRQMIALQGGDAAVVDDPQRLPAARHKMQVASPQNGYVASIQCERVGTACVILGGGRERKEDAVDPAVGITLHKKVGDWVGVGEPICTIHYNSEERAAQAHRMLQESYSIAGARPTEERPLIYEVISPSMEAN